MAFRDFGLGSLRVLRLSRSGPRARLSLDLPNGGDLPPEGEGMGVGWQDLAHTCS